MKLRLELAIDQSPPASVKLSPDMRKRVLDWSDEDSGWGKNGRNIFVTLQPGWCYDYGSHSRGNPTLRDAINGVKRAQPCDCDQCVPPKRKKK